MTIQQKSKLTFLLARFVSIQAQKYEYNWQEDYFGQQAYDDLIAEIKELQIDFGRLTLKDAELFGLCRYKIDKGLYKGTTIYLLPLYLYRLIPDDIFLYDLLGNKYTKKESKGLNNDSRSGYLPYGVKVL